mmetsp:Transcript_1338/g.3781  ORF Transcript_1338/g.3781 Transcript_1338/m.3781 type:complete len:263 (+) Transcript_1338:652-1440(+)
MQASNMMWHRPGWEAVVHRLRWSVQEDVAQVGMHNSLQQLARRHPFYQNLSSSSDHVRQATHYAEGSFYPIDTVVRFASYLRDWVRRATSSGNCRLWQGDKTAPCAESHPRSWYHVRHGSLVGTFNSSASTFGSSYQLDEILFTFPFPEEYWLPAYAMNVERLRPHPAPVAASPARGRQLCYRHDLHAKLVPLELVETMQTNMSFRMVGSECAGEPSNRFFAVKRVLWRDTHDQHFANALNQPLVQRLLRCDAQQRICNPEV